VGDAVGADTRAVALRHLRTRDQFQALLSERPVARTAHFVLHRLRPELADAGAAARTRLFCAAEVAWIGAMVPKRWARRAVTRNAIRRQIYAVTGSLQPPLPAAVHLVRLRAAFAPAQFPSASSAALKQAVRAELLDLFAQPERRA
jgi:ribonuclease P protein component